MENPEHPAHAPLLHGHAHQRSTSEHGIAPKPTDNQPLKREPAFPRANKGKAGDAAQFWKRCTYTLKGTWNKGWTVETCSCIFALISLLGLVATLLAHEDKPLPQWPQLVNINSIISLFSMLMRAGVGFVLAEGISQSKWQWFRKKRPLVDMQRFDSASRGTWGSIIFLTGLGTKRPHFIAALGAFVTVMASLTGFASQQLIQFTDCLQPDESAAVSLAKSNEFIAIEPRYNVEPEVYHRMRVAIDMGILQPQAHYTDILTSGCITGNCTFPSSAEGTLSTLAISHSCEDVTSEVKEVPLNKTITYENGTNVEKPDYINYKSNNGSGVTARALDITLPLVSREGSISIRSLSVLGLVTGMTTLGHNGSLFTIKMLVRDDPVSNPHRYQAISCSLHPTVNTYAAEVKRTVLQEKLIRSIPLRTINNFGLIPFWEIKLETDYTLRNGSREACEEHVQPMPGYEMVFKEGIEVDPTYMSKDCVWMFDKSAAQTIQIHMEQIFHHKGLMSENVERTTSHLRQLYREGNMSLESVDSVFKNVAASMTAVVRTNPPEDQTWPIRGTMWYTTTCIRVRWVWISFPATMIGLCVAFLVLVHVESRDVDVQRLWKSSTLAMLFCEMDETVVSRVDPLQKDNMRDAARSTSVSLSREPGTLKLVAK